MYVHKLKLPHFATHMYARNDKSKNEIMRSQKAN